MEMWEAYSLRVVQVDQVHEENIESQMGPLLMYDMNLTSVIDMWSALTKKYIQAHIKRSTC